MTLLMFRYVVSILLLGLDVLYTLLCLMLIISSAASKSLVVWRLVMDSVEARRTMGALVARSMLGPERYVSIRAPPFL